MISHPVPTDEVLIELYEGGRLANEIAAPHRLGEGDAELFVGRCVQLHNQGKIDLTDLVNQPAFASLETHAFFAAQRFYCEAIPALNSNAAAIMACCGTLMDMSRQDLSASFPATALQSWCARNPRQCVDIVEEAKAGSPLAMRFVSCALRATNDALAATGFVESYNDARRLSGMAALGHITMDGDTAQGALATLRPFVAGGDDVNRARALAASFDILARHPDATQGNELAKAAAQEPGPWALHELASLLLRGHDSLNSEGLAAALGAMSDVVPEHAGTLKTLDSAFHRMLGSADAPLALDSLTALLRQGNWTAEQFPSAMHALAKGDRQRRHDWTVRWLLSGSVALGHAATFLAKTDRDGGFDHTLSLSNLSDTDRALLGRKAIGYLFLYPEVCCAVLVSALRGANAKVQGEISGLLFQPLLVSYASAKECLMRIHDGDDVFPHVQAALKLFADYRAALDAVPDVAELTPSEHQRYVVRQQRGAMMREGFKRAEKSSLIRQLVHTTHLLHGRRSLSLVHDDAIGQRAVPMDLHSVSTYIEVPALEWLDPVGLSIALRCWKIEVPS